LLQVYQKINIISKRQVSLLKTDKNKAVFYFLPCRTLLGHYFFVILSKLLEPFKFIHMGKTTQKNFFLKDSLSKRLAQYGALAVAIAGVTDASGQIVYTDITDYNGGVNTDYLLDLNNDAIIDFEILQNQSITTYAGYPLTYNSLLLVPTAIGNEALVDDPLAGNFAYPFALNSGDVISSGQSAWNNNGFSAGYMSLNWNYSLDVNGTIYGAIDGNFTDVTDKFIGLRFELNGQTHYGWARLDVNIDGTTWVVKDYAFNSTPGAAINAGQTLGVAESNVNNIKIVASDKNISLFNLPNDTSYQLFSTSGQSVAKGNTTGSTFVIEANSFASGIYILELNDIITNAVLTKKIVL